MFIPEITRLGQALRHYRSEQGHNWSLFLVRKIPSLLYPLVRLQRLQYVVLLFLFVTVLVDVNSFFLYSIKAI